QGVAVEGQVARAAYRHDLRGAGGAGQGDVAGVGGAQVAHLGGQAVARALGSRAVVDVAGIGRERARARDLHRAGSPAAADAHRGADAQRAAGRQREAAAAADDGAAIVERAPVHGQAGRHRHVAAQRAHARAVNCNAVVGARLDGRRGGDDQ
nr:hypothetical protein [Tanacetum cinerariifolium]